MTKHHLSMTEGDDENDLADDLGDPWFEENIDEWAERQLAARVAEDAAAGLDAGPWETWEVAA